MGLPRCSLRKRQFIINLYTDVPPLLVCCILDLCIHISQLELDLTLKELGMIFCQQIILPHIHPFGPRQIGSSLSARSIIPSDTGPHNQHIPTKNNDRLHLYSPSTSGRFSSIQSQVNARVRATNKKPKWLKTPTSAKTS